MKPVGLLGEAKVYANPDATISVNAFRLPNGQSKRFQEIASGLDILKGYPVVPGDAIVMKIDKQEKITMNIR